MSSARLPLGSVTGLLVLLKHMAAHVCDARPAGPATEGDGAAKHGETVCDAIGRRARKTIARAGSRSGWRDGAPSRKPRAQAA